MSLTAIPATDSNPCFTDVVTLTEAGSFDDESLRDEVPLFAADGSFAYRSGGPCTRAFMDGLPDGWTGEHLLVDSILVWLQRDRSLSSRWFHHEVLPGDERPVCVAANNELDAEHVAAAFGAPSSREFLVGEIAWPDDGQNLSLYGISPIKFPERDHVLRGLRDAGRLKAVTIGVNIPHRYTGRTFQRTLPTSIAGFHFYIRASRGSRRPVINGFRNAIGPSFTGPWMSIPRL